MKEQIGGMTSTSDKKRDPNRHKDESPVYIKWGKGVTGKKGLSQSQKDAVKKHEKKHSYYAKSDNKGYKPTKDLRNEEFDAYDLVLNYLLETNQVDTIEEANYVMIQMDQSTIQGIVNEYA